MSPSELRIGNLFFRTTGGISMPCGPAIKILTIGFDTVEHCFVDEIPAQIETWGKTEIRHLSPIPLTEEWLVKLGFEKTSIDNIKFVKGLYAIHENYFQSKMTGYNLCIKGVDWYNVASVNHVHQLQNLYFALTGEELKFEQ